MRETLRILIAVCFIASAFFTLAGCSDDDDEVTTGACAVIYSLGGYSGDGCTNDYTEAQCKEAVDDANARSSKDGKYTYKFYAGKTCADAGY